VEAVLEQALAAVPGPRALSLAERRQAAAVKRALSAALGGSAPAAALARALVLAARPAGARPEIPPGAREQALGLAQVLVAQVPGAPLALVEWAQQVVAAALLEVQHQEGW
jgi:hypothetical protein